MPNARVALLPLLLLSFAACGASGGGGASDGGGKRDVVCPDLPRVAEAEMLFDPGLKGPGTFEVDVEADGQKETCTLRLSPPEPARLALDDPSPAVHVGGMVGISRTNDATTCTLVQLAGTFDDGSLAGLVRPGKTTELKLTIRENGKVIGDGVFKPDYTPDECGQMKRHQKFAITR